MHPPPSQVLSRDRGRLSRRRLRANLQRLKDISEGGGGGGGGGGGALDHYMRLAPLSCLALR